MSTMIAEVYEALRDAGASEEKSRAAVALADYDNRFDRVDLKLTSIDGELAVLKAQLGMVKWIVSGVGFGVILFVLGAFGQADPRLQHFARHRSGTTVTPPGYRTERRFSPRSARFGTR